MLRKTNTLFDIRYIKCDWDWFKITPQIYIVHCTNGIS